MSPENLALLARFDAYPDRYGIGMIIMDCSEEALEELLNAAREEGRNSIKESKKC